MFQDTEVVILVMCVISAGVIGRFTKRVIPQFRYFYWGLVFMSVSFLAAVAQGVLWRNLFHSIEHLCFAVSGLLFAIACINLNRTGAIKASRPAVDFIPHEAKTTEDAIRVKAP